MKLLFIDDELCDSSSSASIAAEKLESVPEYCLKKSDFDDAEEDIEAFVPDLIILDLMEDSSANDLTLTGDKTCDWIWKNRFCPIVVYSALPDRLPEQYQQHPFVEVVKKGRQSIGKLKSSIAKLQPHVEAIRKAEASIRTEFAVAMRDVAPYAFEFFSDAIERSNTILRSGRRRLAALMDDLSKPHAPLAAWEQYLFPPIGADIQLGDVLQSADENSTDPRSFYVVLTPSCDMVAADGRIPKVENALVAHCCTMEDGLALIGLEGAGGKKLKKSLLGKVLSQGYFETIIPFPGLRGKIPTMAANLRDLNFISIEDIGLCDTHYLRIASIDSPFRELVSWAYLQVACRPGLPKRDFDSWADEILESVKSGGGSS